MIRKRPSSPVARHPAAGFSLLELLAVLAVIAIMAGMAMPWLLSSLTRVELESAANNIANLMRQTRLRAIKDNTDYVIRIIEIDGEKYVEGQGAIGPVQLTVDGTRSRLYTGENCYHFGHGVGPPGYVTNFYANTVTYQGSGTTTGAGAFCVVDPTNVHILQVGLDYAAGQPRIRKFALAAPGILEGFYDDTGFNVETQETSVWTWY